MVNEIESQVGNWYAGRTIFITGGSGLMGKVFLEKLLYTCPKVDKIYILLRAKKEKQPKARLDEITKLPLFSRIRNECPDRLDKLVAVDGDLIKEGLGLSKEDREKITKEVSIVIHAGASLRLEATLKEAVQHNTEATLKVLNLGKDMERLQVFIHLSTAFCHVDIEFMDEKAYIDTADPMKVIDVCKWMEEPVLKSLTPRMIKPHPNCYTYSKRIAETLVSSFYPELPVCIVRPSIVTPAWNDPLSGWVDNLNGPVGILVGGAKGVIRSMHCRADYNAEVVPVDMAISGLISIGWEVGTTKNRPNEIPVYNLTQGETKPIKWGEIVEKGKRAAWRNPFELMLWYPDGQIRSSKATHDLIVLLTHWIPAYIIDFLMIIFGQKPFMLRVQRRIQDGLDVLQYFTTRRWKFSNDKLLKLREKMNSKDTETFNLWFERVNIDDYLGDCILGARHYLMKEDPKTLPRARRNLKFMWFLDRVTKLIFYFFIIWTLFILFNTVKLLSFTNSVLPFLQRVKI